jgi:hypothetical protein
VAFGQKNISVSLSAEALFVAYGFLLSCPRDFAPGKQDWNAGYSVHPHFEARLAHVHGKLFALLNILFGYLILKLPRQRQTRSVAVLARARRVADAARHPGRGQSRHAALAGPDRRGVDAAFGGVLAIATFGRDQMAG